MSDDNKPEDKELPPLPEWVKEPGLEKKEDAGGEAATTPDAPPISPPGGESFDENPQPVSETQEFEAPEPSVNVAPGNGVGGRRKKGFPLMGSLSIICGAASVIPGLPFGVLSLFGLLFGLIALVRFYLKTALLGLVLSGIGAFISPAAKGVLVALWCMVSGDCKEPHDITDAMLGAVEEAGNIGEEVSKLGDASAPEDMPPPDDIPLPKEIPGAEEGEGDVESRPVPPKADIPPPPMPGGKVPALVPPTQTALENPPVIAAPSEKKVPPLPDMEEIAVPKKPVIPAKVEKAKAKSSSYIISQDEPEGWKKIGGSIPNGLHALLVPASDVSGYYKSPSANAIIYKTVLEKKKSDTVDDYINDYVKNVLRDGNPDLDSKRLEPFTIQNPPGKAEVMMFWNDRWRHYEAVGYIDGGEYIAIYVASAKTEGDLKSVWDDFFNTLYTVKFVVKGSN